MAQASPAAATRLTGNTGASAAGVLAALADLFPAAHANGGTAQAPASGPTVRGGALLWHAPPLPLTVTQIPQGLGQALTAEIYIAALALWLVGGAALAWRRRQGLARLLREAGA